MRSKASRRPPRKATTSARSSAPSRETHHARDCADTLGRTASRSRARLVSSGHPEVPRRFPTRRRGGVRSGSHALSSQAHLGRRLVRLATANPRYKGLDLVPSRQARLSPEPKATKGRDGIGILQHRNRTGVPSRSQPGRDRGPREEPSPAPVVSTAFTRNPGVRTSRPPQPRERAFGPQRGNPRRADPAHRGQPREGPANRAVRQSSQSQTTR